MLLLVLDGESFYLELVEPFRDSVDLVLSDCHPVRTRHRSSQELDFFLWLAQRLHFPFASLKVPLLLNFHYLYFLVLVLALQAKELMRSLSISLDSCWEDWVTSSKICFESWSEDSDMAIWASSNNGLNTSSATEICVSVRSIINSSC